MKKEKLTMAGLWRKYLMPDKKSKSNSSFRKMVSVGHKVLSLMAAGECREFASFSFFSLTIY